MGDKSPKDSRKQANQKQVKGDAVKQRTKAAEDAKQTPPPKK